MENKKRHTPKITATTMEEFQIVSDLLMKLPDVILNQIESANRYSGVASIECTYKQQYGRDNAKYWIPLPCTQITDFGERIGIYAGDYFMVINGENYTNGKFTYVFHELEKK